MHNYKCIKELLDSNDLSFTGLVRYYISYISVFYCIDLYDEELENKLSDLDDYIKRKIGDKNV